MLNRFFAPSSSGLERFTALGCAALVSLAASGCASSAASAYLGSFAGDVAGGDSVLTGDSVSATDTPSAADTKATADDATQDIPAAADIAAPPPDIAPDDIAVADVAAADIAAPAPDSIAVPDTTVPTTQGWGTDGKNGSVQKVTKLAFGTKTEGCDLSGDGKVDNTLSGLSGIAGKPLQDALDKDSLDMIFEPKTYNTSGTAFLFNVLLGDPEAGSTCKNPSAGCNYTVKASSYTNSQCDAASCTSMVSFPDAKVSGAALTATADKFIITLKLSGAPLALTISKVSLKGTVADATSWKTTTAGMLCGYVTDADLNAAIDAMPASALASYGGAAGVKGLLPLLVPSDIASKPGGPKDAKSLGMKIETVSANITGFSP